MSEPTEATASLQVTVLKRTRNRFKADAATLDLDMSEYAQLALDYLHDQVQAGKLPIALAQAIEKYKKARDAKKPASGEDKS